MTLAERDQESRRDANVRIGLLWKVRRTKIKRNRGYPDQNSTAE
jgi:hypothetical protein